MKGCIINSEYGSFVVLCHGRFWYWWKKPDSGRTIYNQSKHNNGNLRKLFILSVLNGSCCSYSSCLSLVFNGICNRVYCAYPHLSAVNFAPFWILCVKAICKMMITTIALPIRMLINFPFYRKVSVALFAASLCATSNSVAFIKNLDHVIRNQ